MPPNSCRTIQISSFSSSPKNGVLWPRNDYSGKFDTGLLFVGRSTSFLPPVFTQSLPRLLPRRKAKRKGRKSWTTDSAQRSYDLFHSRGNGQAGPDVGWVILYLLIVKYNPTGPRLDSTCATWEVEVQSFDADFHRSRCSPSRFQILSQIVSSTRRVHIFKIGMNSRPQRHSVKKKRRAKSIKHDCID